MDNKLKAFLDMIAFSEGTSTSKYTKDNGYDVIVGGVNSPNTFTDMSKHPNILVTVNKAGLKSTAAGRYQQLYKNWIYYKPLLGLKGYYPEDQDAMAIQLIKECKALPLIEAGDIAGAIAACKSRWASLPGAGYGQYEHSVSTLVNQYNTILNGYA